jgi:hypothetical protein
MVLTHARNYRSEDIRQSKKRWRGDLCVVSLLIGRDGARPSLFGSQANTPASTDGTKWNFAASAAPYWLASRLFGRLNRAEVSLSAIEDSARGIPYMIIESYLE